MSGGGNSGGGSTTNTQALPGYAQGEAAQIVNQSQALGSSPIPVYNGQTYAGMTQNQNQAIGNIANIANGGGYSGAVGNSVVNTANNGGNALNVGGGQNINVNASQNPYNTLSNPALAQELQATNTATQNAFQQSMGGQNAQFAANGAFGGSAYNQAVNNANNTLGNTLATNAANVYNNAYNTAANNSQAQAQLNTNTALSSAEANQGNAYNYANLNSGNYNSAQQRGLAAAGLAPQLDQQQLAAQNALYTGGTAQQTSAQNALNAQYQQWYQQNMQPYEQLGVMSSGLAGALGNGAQGITTTQQTTSPLALAGGLIGTGVGGASLLNSLSQG